MEARLARLAAVLGGPLPARAHRAPGRVNLIGDHTDYQDGLCLPVAIDRDVVVAWRPRPDRRVVVRSLDLGGAVDLDADTATAPDHDPGAVEPAWGRTVAAVVQVLAARGVPPAGIDAAVSSTVPVGSGLSSSAAFEVALALALGEAAGAPLAGTDLALAAQDAEHRATGVPCGVMDQMAAVFGVAGHALLLDCRDLSVEPVALPPGAGMLVVHSGLPRVLETSAYAQRRGACEAVAARLGVRTLREAPAGAVAGDRRARHVVSENGRVLAFVDALRSGTLEAAGRLMLESHASLRDDFEVSTPELDLLVDLLMEHGAFGARLTGAGFGGCVVALVPPGRLGTVADGATAAYAAATGLEPRAFPVAAVSGAGPVEGAFA